MSFNLWETESHHFNFVCLFDFWKWSAGFPETSPEIPLYNQVDKISSFPVICSEPSASLNTKEFMY